MYLNFSLSAAKGITPQEIIVLQLLHQNKNEDLSSYLQTFTDVLTDFEVKGYVEYIKGKKNACKEQLVRLSKKGRELLELIETPAVSPGDEQMFNFLVELYFNGEDEDRKIGNKKATLMYISQFRQIMGFTLHEMYYLCALFCAEEKYTKVLEYIFFNKKENPYGKFKDNIESSKLHIFYEENKERVRLLWKEKIKST